jgi:ADP-ribose pyrophosphatase YjhB (NUDIX family)
VFEGQLDGRPARIEMREPGYAGDAENVRRFKVVVFGTDDRVLAVRSRKTIDLPGGRVEWEDDTLADAARREVWETAEITLGPLVLAAAMVATPLGEPQSRAATIMIVASRAATVALPAATPRMRRYVFLKAANLVERCSAGPPELLQRLIEMAELALERETGEFRDARCAWR